MVRSSPVECTNNKFRVRIYSAQSEMPKNVNDRCENRGEKKIDSDITLILFDEYKSWDVKHDRNNRKRFIADSRRMPKYTHISCFDKRQIKPKFFFSLLIFMCVAPHNRCPTTKMLLLIIMRRIIGVFNFPVKTTIKITFLARV